MNVGGLAARRVLRPDGTLGPGVVELDGARIGAIGAAGGRPPDRILAPGFVDLQVNGHDDVDVATADGGDWERLDAILLGQGVTTWCPTLVTAAPDSYPGALTRVDTAARRPTRRRPAIAGVHLEGPVLGASVGAHPREHVRGADPAWVASLPDQVRIVTLGPEAPGALQAIRTLVARGVLIALGHSTATWDQAEAAVEAGARLVTHLFNAMGPFHHRAPGLVGAALTDDRLSVSVIADGVHLSGPALALAFRAKGPGRVVLVTDAVAWRSDSLQARQVAMVDGAPRLADGTIAGSALRMDAAIRAAVAAGAGLGPALEAASHTPARLLGLEDRGALAPGRRADLVALRPDLSVEAVWVGGEQAWADERPRPG